MADFGLLGAVGLGAAADAFGSNKAAKQQAATMKDVLRMMRGLQGEAGVAGQQQLQQLQRALRSIRGGYGQALAETANAGVAGETAARDSYTAGVGEADQALLSRGMFDPQAMASVRRGYSSDLTRALIGIRESVAANRAGLLTQRGNAVGSAQAGIAGQIGSNFDRRYNIGTDMASLQLSQQPTYQPQGQNIGWLLGSLFGGSGGGGKAAVPYDQQPGFVGPPR
jgi:hypothetical protein